MDHVAILFLELGGLFAVLAASGVLARKIGISAIPLYLLAGLLLGEGSPFKMNAAAPFVDVAAEIGVILLLLTLGLEFTASELVSSLRRHRLSGVVDFVLNATPGFVAGWLMQLPAGGILAMGGITWVTSSGIVARTLGELNRLANRETPSVLSILVLEDIAMALFLPILVVVLAGSGPVRALLGVTLAVGAVLVVLWMAHRGGDRIQRLLEHRDDEQVLLRVLGLTFLVAGAAQGVGASAAVGAFLVGIAVPHHLADRARELLSPLRDLFSAVFFVAFGLAVIPASIWPVLPAALMLAGVSVVTKMATGWVAARHDGVGRPGRLRAGTGLIARGEFSILIAGMAVAAGVLDLGPLATAYVMVLAIAGPILTRVADPFSDWVADRALARDPLPP